MLARCWERGLQGNLASAPATKDAVCLLAPLEPRAVSGWMALGLGTNLSPRKLCLWRLLPQTATSTFCRKA